MSDRLTALHSSVERLRDIVEGLDPQQLELPAYPVEWSIADVLSHIGSGAVILRRRFDDINNGRETDSDFTHGMSRSRSTLRPVSPPMQRAQWWTTSK